MTTPLADVPSGAVELSGDGVDELRALFRGAVLAPADPGFDEARRLEDLAIDRQPGLIIQCSGEADVMDGVDLARGLGLDLAVRGGGHHVAGHGSVDGGLVLDLRHRRHMNGVWVDPTARMVRVQGGATWGQVDRETQVFGLAVPGGVVSTTGVGG